MAFETTTTKIGALSRAGNLLGQIRTLYTHGKQVQAALALYQAGTDPAFNAAINALFSSAERTELGQMLTQIDALIADWETNHPSALGI